MQGAGKPVDSADPFDLGRFVTAQDGVYERALAELSSGRKRSHWIWFIFPQIDGLGHSPTARFYAIKSLEEAKAYLAHPLLGARLEQCAEAALDIDGRSVTEIFGYPDDVKLRSSMTLFAFISGAESVYEQVLEKFFSGHRDPLTLRLIAHEK